MITAEYVLDKMDARDGGQTRVMLNVHNDTTNSRASILIATFEEKDAAQDYVNVMNLRHTKEGGCAPARKEVPPMMTAARLAEDASEPVTPLVERLAALSTWLDEYPFQTACVVGSKTASEAITHIEEQKGEINDLLAALDAHREAVRVAAEVAEARRLFVSVPAFGYAKERERLRRATEAVNANPIASAAIKSAQEGQQ